MKKIIAGLMVAGSMALAVPAHADAYMHAANCWNGLRNGGYGYRDGGDGIHRYGLAIGADYVSGPYGAAHFDDTRVYYTFTFHWRNGAEMPINGYCHGSDSNFNDNVPNPPSGWGI